MILQSVRWWIFRVGIPHTSGVYVTPCMITISLCKWGSLYANILAIPARIHTGGSPYAYGNPCMLYCAYIGIQDLISHVKTISLCVRGFPYANVPAISKRTRVNAKNHIEYR